MEPRPGAIQHRPIAFFKIGDAPRQRRQGQSIGTNKHLPLTKTNGEWRALPGANQQIRMTRENHRQRKSAMHALQRGGGSGFRRMAGLQEVIHQQGKGFGIGFGLKNMAARFQFRAQLRMVFDDAIMDNNNARRAMRMRIARGGRAMRCPARMANAGATSQRACFQNGGKIAKLALCTPAINLAVNQGCDTRTVITAIFQPPQRFQKPGRCCFLTNHSDNAAHQRFPLPLKPRPGLTA